MAVFVRQSLALMRFDRNQGALFLALFFQQAIVNLSESVWLQINGAFVFVMMTLAVFSMSRSLLDARMQVRNSTRVVPQVSESDEARRDSSSRLPMIP
jgi:hypothetical protein